MNMHALAKTNFVAPVVATPLSKTEAPIPPTPPCVRRALPFRAEVRSSFAVDATVCAPPGRWDSARAAACQLFTGLIPSRQATTPTATQLELHFA